jgi:hypothetical protein
MVADPKVSEPMSLDRVRRITRIICAVGFTSAVAIYLAAGPPDANPLGYDPLQTKKYLHDMEVYGGKVNVLAEEFREWFEGLWHGRSLAFTVAVLTLLVAWVFRFFATPLPPEAADDEGRVVDFPGRGPGEG